ncbi:Arm DNA-binding domain-containing protein [Candidatus Thioglobus sp.]|uniref:Arm DNA-binding domain-containing protein n=1 Tax=Candidatus Thioglobus sp. TaxID=2026721 RepID=UPI003D0B323C
MITDQKIKSCKAKDKIYRIADANGLALEITPKGVKHWRYRYRFNGKATMASLGTYPLISLAEARSARDRFKKLLFEGINPSAAKAQKKIQLLKQEQERKTFGDMFYEWHVQNSNNWSARHIKKVEQQGVRYLLPYIDPVNQIV